MKEASAASRLSLFLKGLVIVCALGGTWMSVAAGRNGFMSGLQAFKYFTIQSNIAVALLSLAGMILMLSGRAVPNWWYAVRFVGAVAITLTGVVFCFVLAPTMGRYAWRIHNVLTHVVVPVAAVVDFFLSAARSQLRKRSVFLVTIPPLAYALYAGIGYLRGWEFGQGIHYPYFFLNWGSPAGVFGFSRELPFMGTGWWILAILCFLLAVGYGYLRLLDGIQKRQKV